MIEIGQIGTETALEAKTLGRTNVGRYLDEKDRYEAHKRLQQEERDIQVESLIKQWKKAFSANSRQEMERIAVAMSALFSFRKTWQRKHCASYNFATKNGLVSNVKNLNHRVPTDEKPLNHSNLSLRARCRDELFEYCRRHRIGLALEIQMGEFIKTQNFTMQSVDEVLLKAIHSVGL